MVEDDPLQATLISRILQLAGYKVFKAESGIQCLELVQIHKPDVILLDWELPDTAAPELIDRLLADVHNRFLPIIVLTGHSDVEKLELALNKGASDFINKPARKIELLARIRSSLRVADLQNQLNELSIRDPLTGLYNRRFLNDYIELEFPTSKRYGRPLSCALIDIDFFKKINDTHGHHVGDIVIKQLADLLLQNLRKVDIAARYGGEEFLIILPETPLDAALECMSRLLDKALKAEWGDSSHPLQVSFSAGVSCNDSSTCLSVANFFDIADQGLYEAKKNGRSRIEFIKRPAS